ncbi:hypothetical protein NDU88_000413, partial [Pleurodeles waltl]
MLSRRNTIPRVRRRFFFSFFLRNRAGDAGDEGAGREVQEAERPCQVATRLLHLSCEITRRSRKNMPRQKPARMLLSFQDVVSHFSQEEQELLHNWQKDLYANLMKEIHQVLMSLGPVIASTVFSLRLNEKGRFPVDFEEFDRGLNDDYPPKEKTTGIISESIKEEGEVYSSVDEDHEVVAKVFWPVGFHPLTSEPEDAFLNPIDEDGRDGGDRVSAGMAAITSLISSQTKEESAASSEDHLESEIKRSIYNLTEQSGTESMNENEMHRYSLRKHMRIYNSERHFTCTECGKQVNEKSLLESHQRIHPELRPYRCPDCEMIFTGKSSLLAQQKLHMGVKRYHCNACEKSFTQKQHLVTHQKIHTGFRAFHCTVCEKNFTQKCRSFSTSPVAGDIRFGHQETKANSDGAHLVLLQPSIVPSMATLGSEPP